MSSTKSASDGSAWQGQLFVANGWHVVLTGAAARARAVQPIRARVQEALRQVEAAQAELLEFHQAHCPEGALVDCDVCMGRS